MINQLSKPLRINRRSSWAKMHTSSYNCKCQLKHVSSMILADHFLISPELYKNELMKTKTVYIYQTIYNVFTQSETLTRHITCIWQCLRWCFNMCETTGYLFFYTRCWDSFPALWPGIWSQNMICFVPKPNKTTYNTENWTLNWT